MAMIDRNFTFATNGTVTANDLHNLIDSATIYQDLITGQLPITSVGTNYELLIADATNPNAAPNAVTVYDLFQDALTAGTYTNANISEALTYGTATGTRLISTNATITAGTIATLNSTTGTIATLNSTTGTIATLNSTTPTFLGAITASTNTINIGSGQIYKDASGNVGVGTASPSSQLHINQTTAATIRLQSSSNTCFVEGNNDYLDLHGGSQAIRMVAGSTERLRIDSSGNVGIGQSSLTSTLTVNKTGTDTVIQMQEGGTNTAQIESFQSSLYLNVAGANNIIFRPNSTERMRIDSSGNLLVGKTAPSTSTVGFQFTTSDNKIACGAASGASAFFNRNTDDGIIVQIAQDGTVEGNISVSGTTVSYNGGHLSRFSQLPSGQRDPEIKKGTVLSNLDAMCEWRDADGNLLPNEQLNKVKISDVEGDSNTAGVFVNWDNDDQDNPYDLNMAMTGDMIIRIAQGTSVNRGDLLISAGDGTAKPQGDDIIRSKTIAKVTSTNVTCTYEDGSYCVPCVLMAC